MKINSYLTFLSRNKAYTAINVFGLSVSLMFVILIGLYYEHETGVDKHYPERERIILVHSQKNEFGTFSGTSREIIPLLRSKLPQIETACAVFETSDIRLRYAQDNYQTSDIMYVDSTFYDVFGLTLVEGDVHTALADLNNIVLEEEMALRLFPGGSAIGKPLTINDWHKVVVRGIYRRNPNSSLPQHGVIGRYELLRDSNPYMFRIDGNFGSPDVFIKLAEDTDGVELAKQVDEILSEKIKNILNCDIRFSITPMDETYFSKMRSNVCRRGKPVMVWLISFIGVVVLVFAVMNYINLTVAQAGRRAREMATRRLLGSQKRDIALRLMTESVLLCFISVVVSLLLVAAAVPYTNRLLETEISMLQLLQPLNVLLLAGFVLVLGTLAGIVPASVMSTVQPIDVVRGTFRVKTKTLLSRIFMVVQHFITILLVAVTCIFSHHTTKMIHAPLGYETDSLMAFHIQWDAQKGRLFKKKLKAIPGIEKVSLCRNTPLDGGDNNMGEANGKNIRFQRFYGDEEYLSVLGIEVTEQWEEGESENVYASKNLHSTLGIAPQSRSFRWRPQFDDEQHINGIVDDFKLGTLRHTLPTNMPIVTLVYVTKLDVNENWAPGMVMIRVNGDKKAVLASVKEIYKEVYNREFTIDRPWMQQKIAWTFKDESRLIEIMSLFSGIALLISVMGLVAMSTYHIQQHRKEIAVRKVFGSSVAQVRRRLIVQFLMHVGIAALPAVPLVWLLAGEYMATQVFRTVWWPWIPVAVGVVTVVSYISVAIQSRIAAGEKPVKHLKDNE